MKSYNESKTEIENIPQQIIEVHRLLNLRVVKGK
jgi:hypothetical protein